MNRQDLVGAFRDVAEAAAAGEGLQGLAELVEGAVDSFATFAGSEDASLSVRAEVISVCCSLALIALRPVRRDVRSLDLEASLRAACAALSNLEEEAQIVASVVGEEDEESC